MVRRLWLIGWLASILALASLSPALAADARSPEAGGAGFIEVTGEGSVTAAPDFALITLGVATTDKDAGQALAANARAANDLIALVKTEGVAPADIQTSGLSISPVYSQPASGSGQRNAAPAIVGYSVSNTVHVTVHDIPRLGALLDKAVGAGANSVYGVSFGQNDPSALLDKARPLAVADAKRKAEIYAGAGGAKVGRLLALIEEGGPRPMPMAARAYAAAAPTPIEAGEDRLGVTVTARFELVQ